MSTISKTDEAFDCNFLKPGDKIWYEYGFPDVRKGTIKDRRVLYNENGSRYVEYKLTFWSSSGFFNRLGSWLPAKLVVGFRN